MCSCAFRAGCSFQRSESSGSYRNGRCRSRTTQYHHQLKMPRDEVEFPLTLVVFSTPKLSQTIDTCRLDHQLWWIWHEAMRDQGLH